MNSVLNISTIVFQVIDLDDSDPETVDLVDGDIETVDLVDGDLEIVDLVEGDPETADLASSPVRVAIRGFLPHQLTVRVQPSTTISHLKMIFSQRAGVSVAKLKFSLGREACQEVVEASLGFKPARLGVSGRAVGLEEEQTVGGLGLGEGDYILASRQPGGGKWQHDTDH